MFVILALARFEILDQCIFPSNKNHTRLPYVPEILFLYFRDEPAIVSGKATHQIKSLAFRNGSEL